jgi:hypothetical protein
MRGGIGDHCIKVRVLSSLVRVLSSIPFLD